MSHVLKAIAAGMVLVALGSQAHAEADCLGGAELLSIDDSQGRTPCDFFGALYVHNNIETIDLARYPAPEGLDLIGLAVQSFVYRRDHLDGMGMVDHLIAALPLLSQLDEERFAIYSSYIVFNYGKHAAGGRDATGALNPAIVTSGRETRFDRPDAIACFVEVDLVSLAVSEVLGSPRYRDKCGGRLGN